MNWSLNSLFSRLTRDVNEGKAIIASGYVKRMLEGQYDKFFKTKLGQRLKALGVPERYGIEGTLHVFNAILNTELPEKSFLGKTLKEIWTDVPAEFSKRLINGDTGAARDFGEKIKTKISSLINLGRTETPKEKELANLILELDNETLAGLLAWTYGLSTEERTGVLNMIKDFSPEELAKFSSLSEEAKKQMVEIFSPKPSSLPELKPKGELGKKIGETAKKIGEDTRVVIQDATSSMANINEKLRKMREGQK